MEFPIVAPGIFQFIGGYHIRTETGSKILTLCRAETHGHFFPLKVAGRPVIQNSITGNHLIRIFSFNVGSTVADDDGKFQFEIKFSCFGRIRYLSTMTITAIGVGKIENGYFKPIRIHIQSTEFTGGADVLLKGIKIPESGWIRNGR